jgi:hypothetical protein
MRGSILDSHFFSVAGLDRQLEDPDRRARFVQALANRGLIVTPKPPAAAA